MVINASRWSMTAGWRNPPELLITILILIVSLLFGDTRSGELWQLWALSCINIAPCFTCARQAVSSLIPTCLYRAQSGSQGWGEGLSHLNWESGTDTDEFPDYFPSWSTPPLIPVSCSTWPTTPGFMFHVTDHSWFHVPRDRPLLVSCSTWPVLGNSS